MLALERYVDQQRRLPTSGRHILAQHEERRIVVYQAFRPEIADDAVNNRGNFKRRATKLNDSATKTDDPRQTHIPILWDT